MAEAENETQKRQKAERGLVEAIHRVKLLVGFELLEALQFMEILFLHYFRHVKVL